MTGRRPRRHARIDGRRITLRELADLAGLSRQYVTRLLDQGHTAAAIVSRTYLDGRSSNPRFRCSICEHVGHRTRQCPMEIGEIGEHQIGLAWGDLVVHSVRFVRVLLEAGRPGLSVEQMIRATESSKATVYRMLATVREAGWPLRVMHDRFDGRRAYYWIDRPMTRRRATRSAARR